MMPPAFQDALALAHPSWHAVLRSGLQAVHAADPAYLPALAQSHYLPTQGRLFAAFTIPLNEVRHVLIGEGPYPREESATGVCFMDGAVHELWSEKGLSTRVNRATSLRNFMKMLLVCEGELKLDDTNGEAMARVSARARADGAPWIQTLQQLQQALQRQGFLLINAALVFRPEVAPLKEARAWKPFFQVVLDALGTRVGSQAPTLVLWGKVAEVVSQLERVAQFPRVVAEHPYNLSFIANAAMHEYFGPMRLLRGVSARG